MKNVNLHVYVDAQDVISRDIALEGQTCKDGDRIEFPPLSKMVVAKFPRNPNDPSEADYLVQARRNGERCWLSLDPVTIIKLIAGQEITVDLH